MAPQRKAEWNVEEVKRGSADVLIVYKGAEPKGSIEVDTYEEKVAWMSTLDIVNSLLQS